MELVRALAVLELDARVLSVYLRTDPRDPANTAQTPGWLVGLRNGLRETTRAAEEHGPRDERLALRDLRERVEDEVLALDPVERARGLAWFVSPDGSLDRRLALQIPPREHVVRWDRRPFVSPLVDWRIAAARRGSYSSPRRPSVWCTGKRATSWSRSARCMSWSSASGATIPLTRCPIRAGGRQSIHVATFDQRVAAWRQRFLRDAASAIGARLDELNWQRVLLAGEPRTTAVLAEALPDPVRERVVAEVEANLLWEEPAAVAQRLEQNLEAAWRRDARALADRAIQAAQAGGPGAIGWAEVLETLIQHRVEHLAFAVGVSTAPDRLAPHILGALGHPSREMLVERAVEQAVDSGADVTALHDEDADALTAAGGIAATFALLSMHPVARETGRTSSRSAPTAGVTIISRSPTAAE